MEGIASRVVVNLFDLFTITKQSIILPVPSFSLKVIEKYVGYRRKQDECDRQWAMAASLRILSAIGALVDAAS